MHSTTEPPLFFGDLLILLLVLNNRVQRLKLISRLTVRLWGTSTCSDGYVAKPCGCSCSCPDAIGSCSAYSLRKHGSNLAKHRKQGGKITCQNFVLRLKEEKHFSKLCFAIAIKRRKITFQSFFLLLKAPFKEERNTIKKTDLINQ